MTVETPLPRRAPLRSWAGRFAASVLDVSEEPFGRHLLLRLDPADPAAAVAERLIGLPLPPPNRSTTDGTRTVIWAGPDEFLVTEAEAGGAPFDKLRAHPKLGAQLERLDAAVRASGGAVTDVSGQRTTLRLRGRYARLVLAKGCSVDLHPRIAQAGWALQTTVAHAGVIIVVLDPGRADEGWAAELDCRLLVRASFAGYLADWLLDAAWEYESNSTDRTAVSKRST